MAAFWESENEIRISKFKFNYAIFKFSESLIFEFPNFESFWRNFPSYVAYKVFLGVKARRRRENFAF